MHLEKKLERRTRACAYDLCKYIKKESTAPGQVVMLNDGTKWPKSPTNRQLEDLVFNL